jgi:hypothetical protein
MPRSLRVKSIDHVKLAFNWVTLQERPELAGTLNTVISTTKPIKLALILTRL